MSDYKGSILLVQYILRSLSQIKKNLKLIKKKKKGKKKKKEEEGLGIDYGDL